MWNKKILNYSKIFKAVYNNNPRTYSPQQNKQAVLTTAAYSTAAYFKVSTPLRSQRQKPRFVYRCFWYKTEKNEHHYWILHIRINLQLFTKYLRQTLFSWETSKYGKLLSSAFQQFFASANKSFIFGGKTGL